MAAKLPSKLDLLYFDLTKGNRIGMRFLIGEFGWVKGINIIANLKWREQFNDPFEAINRLQQPTKAQQLSQIQMRPLLILYLFMLNDGYPDDIALDTCRRLSHEVAVAFLKYNIPILRKADFEHKSDAEKRDLLNKITKKFFNMESTNDMTTGDELAIDVHTCHFAGYAIKLGVPELGPVFCESDRFFFEYYQHEVDFDRTQTLAIDGKPCDFRFRWKD